MKLILCTVIIFMIFSDAEAYDPLDPFGNITIKWDIMSWTPDGYVATVTMNNFQMFRHIISPGWTLGWSWAKKEVIWSMVGAQTTEQGDCSKFKGNIPHCCQRTPTIVDLLPGVPYNQQFSNCCKGGVVASWGQDPASAISAFQVSVGLAGTSNKTVKLPKNFTLLGPGPGYTCGPAKIVPSTVFLTPDHRRKTQALSKIVLLRIFSFRFKVLAISGFQESNLLCFFLIFLQRHHHALPIMFLWLLMEAGPLGNVQSEVLLQKNKETFTLKQGWAFPRKVYFNGDECKLPPPDAYPFLPNSAKGNLVPLFTLAVSVSALLMILSIW